MPNYTPPDEDAKYFAKFKHHNDAVRDLTPGMRKRAIQALKDGASVGQLARWTGLTDEVFRRIARAEGIERKRAPTVGRKVEQQAHATKEGEGDG